jgi:[acyl-carrier-protein] S-malonyltransferase
MGRQLCSPVKWYDSMIKLIDENMETFVEVGPGRVLAGLLKKILPPDSPVKVYNISNLKQLEKFMNENI